MLRLASVQTHDGQRFPCLHEGGRSCDAERAWTEHGFFEHRAREELAALLKKSKDKVTYQRVQCIWLRAALGLSAPQVAQALGWSLSAVHHLQSRYWRQGAAALLGPGRGGRAHAYLSLTEEQRFLERFAFRAAQGGVIEAGPVRAAYAELVGHAVPKSTVYRLLARHDWRKLAPRPRHVGANAAAQEAFKKSCVRRCTPRPNDNPGRVSRSA